MKTLIAIIFMMAFVCCNSPAKQPAFPNANKVDTFIRHDTIYVSQAGKRDWQKGFGLTHDPDEDTIWGKPVSYYLNDKHCAAIAYEFYYGDFRPSDNGATDELLKYAVTGNDKLRPFYRWCLNQTIAVADGALFEHVGKPARRYAEKFPEEFFEYMEADTTHERYKEWVEAISYSGFYDIDDYKNPVAIRNRLAHEMKQHCVNCSEQVVQRINKFTEDCFLQ